MSEELLNGFGEGGVEALEDESPSLEAKLDQLRLCVDKLVLDLKNKYV